MKAMQWQQRARATQSWRLAVLCSLTSLASACALVGFDPVDPAAAGSGGGAAAMSASGGASGAMHGTGGASMLGGQGGAGASAGQGSSGASGMGSAGIGTGGAGMLEPDATVPTPDGGDPGMTIPVVG